MARLALIVLVLAIVGYFVFEAKFTEKAAANFALYPGGGLPAVSLGEYRGKVVVLDFWASWCGPCRMSIPALERIHQQYKDRGVVVLGINVSENIDTAAFMRQMGASYTVLSGGDDVAREYNVKGIPTLLVISKEGIIKYRDSGWAPQLESKLMAEIEKALAN